MLRSTETKKCCQIISVSSHSKKRKERDPDGGVSSSLISKRERIRPEIRQSSTQESPSSSARTISTLDVQFDSEFYEALKCPICVHFYQPKVFICQNGHSICSNCFENRKRRRCWSCRTPLNGARNHALEKVILDTTFPCQYRKHGCLHRESGAIRNNHEAKCFYRPIPCFAGEKYNDNDNNSSVYFMN